MTAISIDSVHSALAQATSHLLSAAGPDGIISRKDVRAKLLSLEGTERSLVDVVYRFIDARDVARSARVTRSDVDAAFEFIKAELIDRFDLDQNGLSDDEIARMSDLGKLAVALARELKAAVAPSVPTRTPNVEPTPADASDLRGEALAQKLAPLLNGLFIDDFGSEGGAPLTPFHAVANLSALTPDTFRATLGLTDGPKEKIVKFEPAERCFGRFIGTAELIDRLPQGEAVVRFMKANLREIHAVLLGPYDPEYSAEYPLYLVGLDASGNLVGLRTAVIWT